MLGLAAAGFAGYRYWPEDGFFNPCLNAELPEYLANHDVVLKAWEGIDPNLCWDGHVHLIGLGSDNSGIQVHPGMRSIWHPVRYTQFKFYLNASCVTDDAHADSEFVERLLAINATMPKGWKTLLMAFDWYHDESGQPVPDKSTYFTPNDYAMSIAARYPEQFEWIASIHPYREDSIEALEQAASLGARAVKWLPPAMGIDPASSKCDRFYEALVNKDLPLISHGGDEKAVHVEDTQHLGNPLRLRRALDHGVRVIVAHSASLGSSVDLDQGQQGQTLPNTELFFRMMNEPRYEHRLYGEISAITQLNRFDPGLIRRLMHPDWQDRLINASDYPLPGVMPLFSVRQIYRHGLVTDEEAQVILAIRRHNPVLFDFVLKRTLRAGSSQFSPSVFHTRHMFDNRSQIGLISESGGGGKQSG
ncbi:MAG: hypothetical protein BMS9Abin15_0069 [Gammaproteobacteria bacterium]|nr:MAG: hypothetical protein BMS9Abin15_0069 [Gammaproteobacteria bacterium]